MSEKNGQVKFIRKNGRVIPIYASKKDAYISRSARMTSLGANIASGGLAAVTMAARKPKVAFLAASASLAMDGVGFAGNAVTVKRMKVSNRERATRAAKYAAQDAAAGYATLGAVALAVPSVRRGILKNAKGTLKKVGKLIRRR